MERKRVICTQLLRSGWIALLCMGCLLPGGCTAGPDAEPGGEEAVATPAALRIASLKVSRPDSRAASSAEGYTAITTPGAQMGLFRKKDGTWYTATVENLPYEYRSIEGVYQWAAPALATTPAGTLWLNHYEAQIAACYPYSNALSLANPGTGDGIINLTATERSADSPQDLWYGHTSANNRNPAIGALQLRQAYCRMQITVVYDKSFSYTAGDTYLYELSISGGREVNDTKNTGIYSTGTLDMFKDGMSGYTYIAKDYKAITKSDSDKAYQLGETAETTKAIFDLMMLPNSLTGPVKFSVVVGGDNKSSDTREMNVDIPADDFGGSLDPGKIYTVKLTIKGMDISKVTTVTTDWNPTVINGPNTDNHFDMTVQ